MLKDRSRRPASPVSTRTSCATRTSASPWTAGCRSRRCPTAVGHAMLATTKDIYGRMQERSRRNVADAVGATLMGSA